MKQVRESDVIDHGIGADELTYLAVGDRVRSSDKLEALLESEPGILARQNLRQESLYQLLRTGTIPLPFSISTGLRILGPGDRAVVSNGHIGFSYTSPFLRSKSRQDSTATTSALRDRLAQSIAGRWKSGQSCILMQSSGKDSSAIALAISRTDAASHCLGVTFSSGRPDDEDVVAGEIARKVGLKHERVVVDVADPGMRDSLLEIFRRMPYPSVDQAMFAYAACGARYFDKGVLVIDGTGGDAPFGFPGQPWLRTMDRTFPNGLPGGKLVRQISSRRRAWSKLFLGNRAEMFFSNYYLGERELSALMPTTHAMQHEYWGIESRRHSSMDLIEFASMVKLRHGDVETVMRKGRAVASARAAEIAFPWASEEMVDFVFNLPERARFDPASGAGKLLLKAMLNEFLGYDSNKVGKRVFRFDGKKFLLRHREWVDAEISHCAWWEEPATVGPLVRRLYRELNSGLRAHNALLALFSVACWYNHSTWIRDDHVTPGLAREARREC